MYFVEPLCHSAGTVSYRKRRHYLTFWLILFVHDCLSWEQASRGFNIDKVLNNIILEIRQGKAGDKWQVAIGKWQVTCDRWQVTHDLFVLVLLSTHVERFSVYRMRYFWLVYWIIIVVEPPCIYDECTLHGYSGGVIYLDKWPLWPFMHREGKIVQYGNFLIWLNNAYIY